MYSRIIILFLAAFAFGEVISSWEDNDDRIKDLGWLFDVENNEVDDKVGEPTVCDTNDCKSLAREFLSAMNDSVSPCDNFYEFVCGSWKINSPIPKYTPVWGRPFLFQEIVFRRVKGILEEKPKPDDILPVRQAKKWYRACMNVEALEKRGLKPLESILMQVGGWPMTIDAEEWDETDYSWQRIEQHYFQITGSYIFYKVNPSWYKKSLVELSNGPLPLLDKLPFQFENYTGDEYENYKDFISSVIKLFVEHNSANITSKMIDEDVRNLIEFEKALYETSKTDHRDPMTIEDFESWYDKNTEDKGNKINVRKLIKGVYEMINHDTENITTVKSDNMNYFVKLNELLNKTPKRTIVNYIHWHFVSSMLAATTEGMRDIFFKLMKNEFGVTARQPRWLECIKEVKMEVATGYAFTKKYYSEKTDQHVRTMVSNIKSEMKLQIEKSNWLDDETKKIAIEKLESMELFVGTPDWYKNSTYVLNAYKGLVIGVNHFDNVLSYTKYEIREDLRETLRERRSISGREMMDVLEVNAAYDPYGNAMVLPAADFQPPFFTEKLPQNINYGMSGAVIGHEIGHAYDINGITMGFEEKEMEISKQIMEMYYKRAECFLDQFNKYYGVTEPVYEDTTPYYENGSLGRRTRGENMADSTGLHAVFEAYKTMLKKNGPDKKLPGFEKYSDEQMFFIAFGSLWCMDSTKKYEEMRRSSDVHSPTNLRVIGAVSNTNDFARAFSCPKGSPMNPENKCNIWKNINDKVKSPEKRKHSKRKHPWAFDW